MPKVAALFAAFAALFLSVARGAEPVAVELSVPGPRNLSYLPIDLIPRIETDRTEGVRLRIRHVGGGGIALHELVSHQVDFASAGMPAVLSEAASGGDVRTLAAVNDAPLFVLMVRSDLKNQVKTLADLKGKTIGVNTSSLTSKTTSQQLAELMLRSGGIRLDQVRFVAAGQSWEEQSSLLLSKTVDAIMGDEPFASRLLDAGKVFFLANLADPRDSARIPGAGFLHAALITRQELITKNPELVARMNRVLTRTLRWIHTHSADEIAAKLAPDDEQARLSIARTLKKYPRLYSRDGKLSRAQLAETEKFFRSAFEGQSTPMNLKITSIIHEPESEGTRR